MHHQSGKVASNANRNIKLWPKLSGISKVSCDFRPKNSNYDQSIADLWARGTVGSYQAWANQVGDQSYTFNSIFPYFEKSPHFTPPDYTKRGTGSEINYDTNSFNSNGGPLQVSFSNFYQPISSFIKQAFLNLGIQDIAGLNSGKLIGFSEFTLTIDPEAGTRSSSETSFLQDSIASTTIQVYQQTLAKSIVFDGKQTATGVNVVTAGEEYTLSATKEVILSAGVVKAIFLDPVEY